MLSIDAMRVGYGASEVLNGVSLNVETGEIVALLGSNGAGKSTLLKTVSGLVKPRGGRIELAGQRLDGLPPHSVAQLGVAHVPEGRRIFPDLSVRENLAVGAAFLVSRREVIRRMDELFDQFPLLHERRHQLGGTLSGGEQQLLAIARGMMARPRCLLLDEPSLGLSPIKVEEVFQVIRQIGKQGIPVLLAEQNMFAALEVAHRGYVLELGQIGLSGEPRSIIENPCVRRAYLGL